MKVKGKSIIGGSSIRIFLVRERYPLTYFVNWDGVME